MERTIMNSCLAKLNDKIDVKTCSKCGKEKPTSEFYKYGGQRLDLHSECKTCFNSRNRGRKEYHRSYNHLHREEKREHYLKHKEHLIELAHVSHLKIKWKYIQLLGGKCQECSMIATKDNICIFDFHHMELIKKQRNERRGTENPYNKNFDTSKVILLCANCHRLKHHNGEENKW